MSDSLRLDKWLWYARFFKTRSLASKLVQAGKVRVNSVPVSKSSRTIVVGDVLTFPQAREIRVVKIAALANQRGPAPVAQALYEDLTPQPEPKPEAAPRVGPKPDKRERRAMEKLKSSLDY